MSERTYYVLCADDCKFEGMTKEQIIAAIAEATGATPTQIDAAFITKIKEKNRNAPLKFWIGTQAEYNALATIDANTFYIFTDSDELSTIEQIAEDAAEAKAQEICQPLENDIDDLEEDVTAIQTELDKKGVVLFDGSQSSNIPYGDSLIVEVEGLSDYTVVAVQIGGYYGLGYISRTGDNFNILGSGTGNLNSSSSMQVANIMIHGSGNTITENKSTSFVNLGGTVQAPSQQVVKKIIGIM